MTADAAHVAAVESALLNAVCACENRDGELAFLGCAHCDATVAVETLTPLIRAQVAAEIRAHAEAGENAPWRAFGSGLRTAARIAEGTP